MEERFSAGLASGKSVTVLKTAAKKTPRLIFAYAPGAGSNLMDPFGAYCSERLALEGIEFWRFVFPYMESGRRAPDQAPVLEDTWRSVIKLAQARGLKLAVAGRSMGGRIASQVIAADSSSDALVLFAYPLHPPGKGLLRRAEHLSSIKVPTLFCSGTRDNFATPPELAEAAALVSGSCLKLLDGADHGFATLKSSGRTRQDVWEEATRALIDFLISCLPSTGTESR